MANKGPRAKNTKERDEHQNAPQFVLKNRATGQPVAVVEATSVQAAEVLGRLLQLVAALDGEDAVFVAQQCFGQHQLPIFRQGFFDLLASQFLSDTVH
jgi:hypothetical protein